MKPYFFMSWNGIMVIKIIKKFCISLSFFTSHLSPISLYILKNQVYHNSQGTNFHLTISFHLWGLKDTMQGLIQKHSQTYRKELEVSSGSSLPSLHQNQNQLAEPYQVEYIHPILCSSLQTRDASPIIIRSRRII